MGQLVLIRSTTTAAIQIWDVAEDGTMSNRRTTALSSQPRASAASKDRNWLAVGDATPEIHLYPFNGGTLGTVVTTSVPDTNTDNTVSGLAFSNDSTKLAALTRRDGLRIYDVNSDGTLTLLDSSTEADDGANAAGGISISW